MTARTGAGRILGCALSLVALGSVVACTEPGPVAPVQHCNQEAGIEVCLERLLFAPGDPLPFEIANRTEQTVHACAGEVVGRRDPEDEWNLSFGVFVHGCPPSEAAEDPLAGTRSIAPGGRIEDGLHVNDCAYEGQWKVNIFVIDEAGEAVEQVSSPIFDVRGRTAFYCRS